MPVPLSRLLAVALALTFASVAHAQPMGGGPRSGASAGPTIVGVVTAERTPVDLKATIPGRALASEETAVRPRVSGMITEILYTPGTPVKVGDALFRIEDDVFRATLAATEASLIQAQTARDNAQATVERIERLGNSSTRVEADTARAALASAEAQLISATNNRDIAKRDLGYTTVVAPIEGIVGLPDVTIGDLVSANQATGLTTITRLDPIYIDLSEPTSRLMDMRRQIEAGVLSSSDTLDVTLTLDDGSKFDGAGRLIAPGIKVSTTTGTQTMRFAFDNPSAIILPGMFLRGEITIGSVDAVLVPQRATSRGNDGTLTVWIVGEGNKSEQRRLTTMGSTENKWIVTEGLTGGEQILVDGLRNMQVGRELAPTPVQINALGLVEDLAPKPEGERPAGAPPRSGN